MLTRLGKFREALSGQKTYIVAVAVIAIGVIEGVLGVDLPGVDIGDDWMMYVLNGFGLGTLRAGVAKAVLR